MTNQAQTLPSAPKFPSVESSMSWEERIMARQERQEARTLNRNAEAGRPARTGMRWDDDEERKLREAFGRPLADLESEFQRSAVALVARMGKLGLLDEPESIASAEEALKIYEAALQSNAS